MNRFKDDIVAKYLQVGLQHKVSSRADSLASSSCRGEIW